MHRSLKPSLVLNLADPRCTISINDDVYCYRLSSDNGKVIINVTVTNDAMKIRKAGPINITVPDGIDYVLDLSNCFAYCTNLEDISELASIDSTKIISLNNTFRMCRNLRDLKGLSDWDVSNVIDMSRMFFGCEWLRSLHQLSSWNPPDNCKLSLFYVNDIYRDYDREHIPIIHEYFRPVSIPEWLTRREQSIK